MNISIVTVLYTSQNMYLVVVQTVRLLRQQQSKRQALQT